MTADQGYHGSMSASEDAMFKTKSHFISSADGGDSGY